MDKQQRIGLEVLRLGLAVLYLWFGFSQLFDGINWVSWVPNWTVMLLHIPPAMIVLLNGTFEVIAGGLLAMGIFVRPISFLLTAHLALVTFDIGLTAIGMRDLSITISTLALGLLSKKQTSTTSN